MCLYAGIEEHAGGVQATRLVQWPRVLVDGSASLAMFQGACLIWQQFALFGGRCSAHRLPMAAVLGRMLP